MDSPILRDGLRATFVLKTSVGGMWIIPQIRALTALGFDCSVVMPAAPGRLRVALERESVTIVDSPFSFSFRLDRETLQGLRALRALLCELRPSVVIYHLYASALAARISSLGLGVRRVHMVAGPLYLESRTIRIVEGFIRARDDLLFSGSAYTWNAYERLIGPNPRMHAVLPYGVDTGMFKPKVAGVRGSSRSELGLAPEAFVAIMVAYTYAPKVSIGQRVGVKGHEIMLEAWEIFEATHPGCPLTLLIVGSGFDDAGERHRQKLIESSPVSVQWIETAADVQRFYAAADVSVSPSLSENHGAALEAGATATPQIVSDAGGLPETVTADTGWVYSRHDVAGLVGSLEMAYDEFMAGVLEERGLRARAFVQHRYDSNASAKKFAEAVLGLIGDPNRQVWKFVTEARYRIFGDGSVNSPDGVNGDRAWARYAEQVADVMVAGRSEGGSKWSDGDPLSKAGLYSLPSYYGVRGLVLSGPRVCMRLWRYVLMPGLLIVRLPGPLSLIAVLAAHIARRPYAVELVGDVAGVLQSGIESTPRFTWPAIGWATRVAVRNAACVRYVTRESLQAKYPAPGVPTVGVSNVRLLENELVPSPRAFDPGRAISVVSVGSQENPYKGYSDLLDAIAAIRREGVLVELQLIGQGAYQASLREQASLLGIAPFVHFEGQVPRDRVLELLRESDVYVQPSLTEGLPRALVEAMAQGLPVVGTNVGGIPELVGEQLLVPPGDPAALSWALRSVFEASVWEAESIRSLGVARGYSEVEVGAKFSAWYGMLHSASNIPKISFRATLRRLRRAVRAFKE